MWVWVWVWVSVGVGMVSECCHIKVLNIECAVCHVTGNICSLVHSSPQTPKMIVICRAWSYFTKSCKFTSAFAGIYKQKSTRPTKLLHSNIMLI